MFAGDEASPAEVRAEHQHDLVLLEQGDITGLPPWTTVAETIAWHRRQIAELDKHIAEFGDRWSNPTED